MQVRDFSASNAVLGFCILLGWACAGISVLAAAVIYDAAGGLAALTVGLPGVIGGVVLVAVAQMGQAVVNTAEISGAILAELRAMRETGGAPGPASSGSAPRRASVPRVQQAKLPGGGMAPAAAPPSHNRSLVKVYKGVAIERTDNGIEVEGQLMDGVLAAERYIDEGR